MYPPSTTRNGYDDLRYNDVDTKLDQERQTWNERLRILWHKLTE